jgi:hypothetical protein
MVPGGIRLLLEVRLDVHDPYTWRPAHAQHWHWQLAAGEQPIHRSSRNA